QRLFELAFRRRPIARRAGERASSHEHGAAGGGGAIRQVRAAQSACHPGYLPQKVVVAPLRFPEGTALDRVRTRLDAIAQRIRALPGVHSVAFSDEIPMINRVTVEMQPPGRADAWKLGDIYTGS